MFSSLMSVSISSILFLPLTAEAASSTVLGFSDIIYIISCLMKAPTNTNVKDTRRWIVMLVFSFLNFSNAIGYINLNGIVECAAEYYHEPISSMLNVADASNFIFIVFGWLAIPLLNWRLDYTIIGGAIFTCASFWMRLLARHSFFAGNPG